MMKTISDKNEIKEVMELVSKSTHEMFLVIESNKEPYAKINVVTLLSMMDDINLDEYNRGYNDGHNDGHDEGYEEGYSDGHVDGYKDGHSDGKDEGHDEGYEEGYSDCQMDNAENDY